MNAQNITWQKFETINTDKPVAFERMCRLIFNFVLFQGEAVFKQSPNNAGVEIEPLFCDLLNKRVSFQSKYFSSSVDYSLISHSFDTTIKTYNGKIDTVYLYCNKDFTLDCKQYKNLEKKLNDSNIELISITNQSVLDLIITNKNEIISDTFFGAVSLSDEWFSKVSSAALSNLEPRFNNSNNVLVANSG